MPAEEEFSNPLDLARETRPGSVVFDEMRRECRAEVSNLYRSFPDELTRLAKDEPYLVPNCILQAFNDYLGTRPEAFNGVALAPSPLQAKDPETWGGSKSADSDELLIAQYYAGDDQAFDILYNRKSKKIRISVSRRYPGLDADEIYDDAFQKIANTRDHPKARYEQEDQYCFEDWLWRIVRRCAADALRGRTPVKVLATRCVRKLPSLQWKIVMEEESVKFNIASRTFAALKAALEEIQRGPKKTRWKWAFDMAIYAEGREEAEDEGGLKYLQFRIYSNIDLRLEALPTEQSFFRNQEVGFGSDLTTMTTDQAVVLRTKLCGVLREFFVCLRKLKNKPKMAVFLCDLLGIPLADTVCLLQRGQAGSALRPPFGTVGQWRSTGKTTLRDCPRPVDDPAEEPVSFSADAVDSLLSYMSCAYCDPNLDLQNAKR